MREIELLAERCGMSPGDILHLAREAAGDMSSRIRGPEDLTAYQLASLRAVIEMLAAPVDVERYELELGTERRLLVAAA
jgi:hypothetical protein